MNLTNLDEQAHVDWMRGWRSAKVVCAFHFTATCDGRGELRRLKNAGFSVIFPAQLDRLPGSGLLGKGLKRPNSHVADGVANVRFARSEVRVGLFVNTKHFVHL